MPNLFSDRLTTIFVKMFRPSSVFVALVLCSAPSAVAESHTRTERICFENGANGAVVENSITGYETADYVVNARKGQYMNVGITTDNASNYFDILAPGEDEAALFKGSIGQNRYEGILPESGDYKVRVYLMRSAARRNETGIFRLETVVTEPLGSVSVPTAGSSQ